MSGTIPVSPIEILAALAAGFAFGFVHFRSLRRVSDDYLAGNAKRAIALQFVRLTVMVVLFVLLARLGALPLLAGAGGLFAARFVVLRKARQAP